MKKSQKKFRKIIFKNFFLQKLLGFLTALYIYFVKITSSIEFINKKFPDKFWMNKKPFILAFWHSQLMMISFSWSSEKKINILASSHSDGRFGAIVGKYFNLNNIQVSKDKITSSKIIFKLLKEDQYVGITPDGPRGPKETVSDGIIKIAKKTNIPIIPFGFWSSKNYSLNSWDNFLITLPFSKCCYVWDDPIYITEDLDNKNLERYKNLIQNKINKCITNAKKKITNAKSL